VIIGLFLLCVGVIVWSFWFRDTTPSATATEPTGPVVSEAQRFYKEGQRLARTGNKVAARDVWRNLVRSFRGVGSEEEWVNLAEQGLAKMKDLPADDERWASVRQALQRARELRDQGKKKEAEEVWQGLEELYWNDPAAREVLQDIQRDRGK
jgi:hypothetical protein